MEWATVWFVVWMRYCPDQRMTQFTEEHTDGGGELTEGCLVAGKV